MPRRVHALDALALGERLGSRCDEQDVLRAVHDRACEAYRVPNPAHARHTAGAPGRAAHQRRVVLDLAVLVHHGSAPGVEQRVILQLDGRGLDSVEGAAAAREDCPARLGGPPQPVVVGLLLADGSARAAVDDQADSSSSRFDGRR
jgi:hypothetical protein